MTRQERRKTRDDFARVGAEFWIVVMRSTNKNDLVG